MVIGYCRVSSKGQIDNNSLEQQEREIIEKYNNVEIYKEQYTGTTMDRPVLNEVLDKLNKGDTLVVSKLDRLARTTKEGITIIEMLFNKGVAVHVLNVGLLENTIMGRFFLTTLLAVAEMERNMIIERTRSGKEIARTKEGYKEGRPKKYSKRQIDNALSMLTVNGGIYSYKEVEELVGISKSTLIRAQKQNLGIY
ncbi:MAG: recombinase family protein [Clostridium baratii]|uniref:recombinase family protein n=1 Tax=Clostridium baratii TaxID=1561 RepID=UPI00242E8D42|nr:recombinase family protein [Clostridium baratii]MBS6042020.1 recombinase family protein [Clostridium baratii]